MKRLPDPAQSYAVIFGVSRYEHLPDLPAVKNNLKDLRDVLVDDGLGSLPTAHVEVVEDPAGRKEVYRALRKYADLAEDTFIVYFAGHGLLGLRNELHLAFNETDPDELFIESLPYQEVREIILKSPARNRVVILDCCFSGRAIAAMSASTTDAIVHQMGIEGTYILTATEANVTALAPPGDRHTSFTGALIELLRKGIPGDGPLLTVGSVFPHLNAALTRRNLPRPRQQGSDTVTDLALVRNASYHPPIQVRDSPAIVTVPDKRPSLEGLLTPMVASTSPEPPALERPLRWGEFNDPQPMQAWKIGYSLWLIFPFIGLGFLTWSGFVYLAGLSRRRSWWVSAAIHALAAAALIAIIDSFMYDDPVPTWPGILIVTYWLAGIIHSIIANFSWLKFAESERARGRWVSPSKAVNKIVDESQESDVRNSSQDPSLQTQEKWVYWLHEEWQREGKPDFEIISKRMGERNPEMAISATSLSKYFSGEKFFSIHTVAAIVQALASDPKIGSQRWQDFWREMRS